MSSPLSESMERILDRFDDAWNGPTPPSIEDYLRGCEPAKRRALLIELVYIDLERRLTAGERVRVEEMYLRRFPVLNGNRAAVVALAVREFELRRRREPELSPTEYLERWPQYRDELTRLLCSHPTLPTRNGETRDGKELVDGQQDSEETRDVFALLIPPQAADEIGRLGGYRVLKVLGSGGMGVVFLAEDAQLQRPVALKVMRPGLAANNAARQRFLREARAVAALKHDHIVTIYQVGEDRGVPFLAMEYLEGESLHDRLKRETILPLVETLRLGVEIAEGLAVAHARDLVHRDIKPANIWLEFSRDPKGSANALPFGSRLNETGRVKLLDFGLARPAGGDDAHLTQTGVILGTPAFMSPEQARGEHVDHRSDLFSLGCVLYRMMTGHLPFQGRDLVSTLLSLANDHPKPPRELNPQVPPALNNLIQRLLAKDVADRPSSAQSVVKALQTLPTEPEPKPLPPPRPQSAPPPPRRRRLVLAALALLGMTAFLAAIVIRIRGKDGRETTIEVPEGSNVTIEQEGKVVVDLSRDRQGAVVPPLVEGTDALSPWALVRRPARLKGVRSWTIDTRILRGGPNSCAMRPDGRQLAVGSFDGVIRLYDPKTGRVQQALYGQKMHGTTCSLTWSRDGKRLASCREFGDLHIWNTDTGQLIRTISPNSNVNCCVAWSPDGKLLAFGTTGGMTLWDPDSGKQVHSFDADGCIHLAWSPDDKSVASGTWQDSRTWNIATKKELQVRCAGGLVGWSADSKAVLTWDGNGLVRWWDRQTGELLRRVDFPLMTKPWPLLSPKSQYVGFPRGSTLHIGDVSLGKSQLTLVPLRAGQWLALRPDGHYRGSPGVEKEIVYVVQTDAGQEVLAPDEFAKKYGWKNDPQRVRLPRR